jgi:hypothetical protein
MAATPKSLTANVHVGKEADHDLILNALQAGIALGKQAAKRRKGYWGPNTQIVDGILRVEMIPRNG